jgi:hypothetical protein
MKLFKNLISAQLVFAPVWLAAASVPQKQLRGDDNNFGNPIDPSLVAESISTFLWNSEDFHKNGRAPEFFVGGSYAAALLAPSLKLPYNDIDVWVQAPRADKISKCQDGKQHILNISYHLDVIPGYEDTEVNIVQVCYVDMKEMITTSFDINAVRAGFAVDVVDQDDMPVPTIKEWYKASEFDDFLETKMLGISKPDPHISNVIRVLRKAEQLGMQYSLMSKEELKERYHGALLSALYKEKLDSLKPEFQEPFTSVFDIHDYGNRYLLVAKGEPVPTARVSRRSLMDWYDYDTFAPIGGGGGGSGGSGCFSEFSTVHVDHVPEPVAMKDLQVGDRVLTASGRYEQVYAFGHFKKDVMSDFLEIETELGKLDVTAEHLVFLSGQRDPVRADQVTVGTKLQGVEGAVTVTQIKHVRKSGLYAPLTESGTLVADGVYASCYIWTIDAPISQHMLAHATLTPFRKLCGSALFAFCREYTENGMPQFIDSSLQLASWFNSIGGSSVVKNILLAIYVIAVSIIALLSFAIVSPTTILAVTFGVKFAARSSKPLAKQI